MRIVRFGPESDWNDLDQLKRFFTRLPEADLTFAKEDPLQPGVLEEWLRDSRALRYFTLATCGSVIGYVAVIPGVGLSSHVGELRLIVDPEWRRQCVGKMLAREALATALSRLELRKIFVEVLADQEPAIHMFRSLGFTVEAVLVEHLLDESGRLEDLVSLAHFAQHNYSRFDVLGIRGELS